MILVLGVVTLLSYLLTYRAFILEKDRHSKGLHDRSDLYTPRGSYYVHT